MQIMGEQRQLMIIWIEFGMQGRNRSKLLLKMSFPVSLWLPAAQTPLHRRSLILLQPPWSAKLPWSAGPPLCKRFPDRLQPPWSAKQPWRAKPPLCKRGPHRLQLPWSAKLPWSVELPLRLQLPLLQNCACLQLQLCCRSETVREGIIRHSASPRKSIRMCAKA